MRRLQTTNKRFDAHMTDPRLARAVALRLLDVGLLTNRSRVLEPSAGDGAFVRGVRSVVPRAHITAVDIRVELPELTAAGADQLLLGQDFLAFRGGPYDLVAGNPPFGRRGEGLVERHVEHALSLTAPSGHVAFLARLGLFESSSRAEFWQAHPAMLVDVLVPRPSFRADGRTDNAMYAVFVWAKAPGSGSRRGHAM